MHQWISDTLSGKARVQTKAASEMLIRWQLSTLHELAEKYGLTIDVALIKSHANRADPLTRVPQQWLDVLWKEAEPIEPVCAASMGELDPACIWTIHRSCGHPGVKHTHYFIKLVSLEVSKAAVREVVIVRRVSVHRYSPGELEGRQTGCMRELEEGWNGCDPPWRLASLNLNQLRSQSICYLEAVIMPGFCQHHSAIGNCILREEAPVELLTDNATTFSGETFSKFAEH